jgi:hypothetical protein
MRLRCSGVLGGVACVVLRAFRYNLPVPSSRGPWIRIYVSEANSSSARQKFWRVVCNPQIRYRVYKNPPLSQARWIQSTPLFLVSLRCIYIYIYIYITVSSMPGFSKLSFKLFPPKPYVHFYSLSHPSQLSWFDNPNNIWWGVQIMKRLNMQLSPVSCSFLLVSPKYHPQLEIV